MTKKTKGPNDAIDDDVPGSPIAMDGMASVELMLCDAMCWQAGKVNRSRSGKRAKGKKGGVPRQWQAETASSIDLSLNSRLGNLKSLLPPKKEG